ncbi:MIF4G domain-containing protein [Abeliophyllum distichum]|uniref:MIF4G domain-containing protein n=1 Tax=Abeliophyllum distichum TaxID=126358 RepID=A0ABD1TGD9_9LAMI
MVVIFPRVLRSPPPPPSVKERVMLEPNAAKSENEGIENNSVGLASPPPPGVKEKVMLEPNAAERTMPRTKKKRKESYRKAKDAGTSFDLYLAYKGPEEKKETDAPAQNTENALSNTTDVTQDIAI